MPLAASCDALYFPEQPRDNVIGLRWQANDLTSSPAAEPSSPLEPNMSLVYKIKSTAPQLFHVKPHFGAMLLADPAAVATPLNFQTTSVQFGLRSNYAAGGDANSLGASPGDAATVASRRTVPYTPENQRRSRHQERFVVEYTVIKCEPLAYQQLTQAFHDAAKLTEVVKSIWALISSGAVARAHVALRGTVELKVYMTNVFLNEADATAAGQSGGSGKSVVVPANAKLVPCSLGGSSVSRSTLGGASPTSGSGGVPQTSPTKKGETLLRTLKEEVKALRQEVCSPNEGTSPSYTPVNGNYNSSALPPTPDLSAARKHLLMNASDLTADGEDILMKVNLDPNMTASDDPSIQKKRKGLKLYLLLLIMFTVYVLCMLMRRGGEAVIMGNAVMVSPSNGGGVVSRHVKKPPAAGGQKKLHATRQPGIKSPDL